MGWGEDRVDRTKRDQKCMGSEKHMDRPIGLALIALYRFLPSKVGCGFAGPHARVRESSFRTT